jgi:hypothetical protein
MLALPENRQADPDDENDWPQQFVWLQNALESFEQAFRPALSNRSTTTA